MAYIRVKDKTTGHEYSIHEHLFNGDAHEKSDKPAIGRNGDVAPPKFRTTVAKAAAAKPATPAAPSGQQADPKKES